MKQRKGTETKPPHQPTVDPLHLCWERLQADWHLFDRHEARVVAEEQGAEKS